MLFTGKKFEVLDHPAQATGIPSSAVFELRLDLSPKPVCVAIAATDQQATMSDLIPAARQLASVISITVVGNLRAQGQDVPCKKGCDACCDYMVSLSPAEAFRLAAEIENMAEPQRRQMLISFDEIARKILASPAPEPTAEAIDNWYRAMDLTCLFLGDHLCQQYEIRPIVCREHIVTFPATQCSQGDSHHNEPTKAAPSIAEALVELSAELEHQPPEAVMLPLAIAWAQVNDHRARQTWPAKLLAQRFVAIIQAAADKSARQAA